MNHFLHLFPPFTRAYFIIQHKQPLQSKCTQFEPFIVKSNLILKRGIYCDIAPNKIDCIITVLDIK